jgi:hypothetical protein
MHAHRYYVDRIQKLKDARAEAQKEIEEYKQTKEQEFNAFQATVRLRSFYERNTVLLIPWSMLELPLQLKLR